MKPGRTVSAFAPATVANVACGFDILGFALNAPGDTVTAELTAEPTLRLDAITGDGGLLAPVKVNVATVSAQAVLDRVDTGFGVRLKLKKGIPLSSGLGGSAASAVAAAVAVDALFEAKLTNEELLDCALEGERVASGSRHADNAAPALYGGFVLVRPDHLIPEIIPLPVPSGMTCAVLHPDLRSDTSEGRNLLEKSVPLEKVVAQTANVAGLVSGLHTGNWELIQKSLNDAIIEPQRSPLIPGFANVQAAALDAGALGCSISGSGPAVFALCRDEATAQRVIDAMADAFRAQSDRSFGTYLSGLPQPGARVIDNGASV